MTRFLVTGASGLLGINLCLQIAAENEVIGVVHQQKLSNTPFTVVQADLSDPKTPLTWIENLKPDVIVHCAAMANIDACERDPLKAKQVNADLPEALAFLSHKNGIQMIHISTDAVFDGIKGDYHEDDQPNPLGVYAQTKLAGEQAVLAANADAAIARVNFYGYSVTGSRSLSEFFFNNLEAGKEMMGFTDVFFCPLFVIDLADVLLKIVKLRLKGIYHTVSSECLNKYEFGNRIANLFNFNPNLIKPVKVSESGLIAERSPNLTMSTEKLAKALGKPLPKQQVGLERLKKLYEEGYPKRVRSFAR